MRTNYSEHVMMRQQQCDHGPVVIIDRSMDQWSTNETFFSSFVPLRNRCSLPVLRGATGTGGVRAKTRELNACLSKQTNARDSLEGGGDNRRRLRTSSRKRAEVRARLTLKGARRRNRAASDRTARSALDAP